jgi:hypothetical protein
MIGWDGRFRLELGGGMRILAAAVVFLVGCGGSNSSPEAVFNSAKKAGESKDWKAMYGCFDPEKGPELLGGMLMMAGFSVMQDKEAEKELNALCVRHGFDPDKQKGSAMGDPKDALKSVKDPAGFFHDLITFSEKKSKKGEAPKMDMGGELSDLKTEGDKATGNVVTKDGKKKPIAFVRRNGAWYLTQGN